MKTLNTSQITNGLVLKVLKACNNSLKTGVKTTVKSRHDKNLLTVEKVIVKNKVRFIVTDNNGVNIAQRVAFTLSNRGCKNAELFGARNIATNTFLWSHEISQIKRNRD